MPKKYRLVRTDPGTLDLSQVLDEQGRPVLLKKANDFAIVDEATSKHPMIQRFVGAGLKLEEVSLTPVQAPATPVVDKVAAPPKPAPEPPKPPPAPPEVMTKETVKDDAPAKDTESKATAPPKNTSAAKTDDKPKASGGKKAKRKYGSK